MRIDHALVERLERSAAEVSIDNVEAAQRFDPSSPSVVERLGNGALVASGPDRYVNRAIGITIGELTPGDVDAVERFYAGRGLDPMIELSSWAPATTVAVLRAGGYAVEWFRSMFATAPAPIAAPDDGACRISVVTDDLVPGWLDVLAIGNAIDDLHRRAISDEHALANRIATGVTNFVALDAASGAVIGCGSTQIIDGIAWVGGAATLPDARGRGIQSALLLHRIAVAAAAGCELVAATAVTNGGSARNLGRLGFSHVQTQAVVARRRP